MTARGGRSVALVAAVAGLCSCGAPQRGAGGEQGEQAGGRAEVVEPPRPRLDPRALFARATFGRLVDSARQLDEAGRADSTSGCLLRAPSGPVGFRLEADLAVSVRPLPDPPADLDALLRSSLDPVRPLSSWGQLGDSFEGPILAAFTTLPPSRGGRAVALLVTDQGVYVRPAGGAVSEQALRPVSLERAIATAPELAPRSTTVFVTAEPQVRLSDLARLLGALPEGTAAALAVVLPEGTRLPPGTGPAPPPPDTREDLCPEDAPEAAGAPAGEDPTASPGEIEPSAIVRALAPLREAGSRCLAEVSAPSGGAVALRFRIGADGAVAAACAEQDQVRSPALRRCLLEALGAIRFPLPRPAGPVEVSLPLVLAYEHQDPLCTEGGRR